MIPPSSRPAPPADPQTSPAPLFPDDVIAAIATAPGRGALAVVRVSGHGTHALLRGMIAPWPGAPRVATRARVRGPAGEPLDDAVVLRYDAPHSYTGEEAVEIITHGGGLVPALVLEALLAQGARQALPGEFTRRAVLAGKMDLLQAEAVADLTTAGSRAGHRAALQQLDGGLSRRIDGLRDALLELEALIAYDIDFPEEDDGPVAPARIAGAVDAIDRALDTLLATSKAGELVREGALVVIAGAPNAGKSSLFNALLGHQRAIVTPVPGTTRDALEAVVDGGRWPLRLVDTAGLRDTDELVERLGIEVSERYLRAADLVLACADDATSLEGLARTLATRTAAPVLRVRTKADLATGDARAGDVAPAIAVSATTGEGLDALLEGVTAVLDGEGIAPPGDEPMLTRARHRVAVERAKEELERFRDGWREQRLPAVVAAVHLRAAVGALEELVGAVGVEEVLGRLFERFCVGK
ncbi:MAG TPA: tRNA uridine-5-carboxymethylaminomethyl(34) synthesis GTPase MnmE [Gemmatimonadaceae bacterium]